MTPMAMAAELAAEAMRRRRPSGADALRKAFRGLALCGLLALAILYGFLLHRQQWFPYRQLKGVFVKGKPEDLTRRFQPAAGASTLAQRDAVGALMQIPYLSGYDPARGEVGVTVYDAVARLQRMEPLRLGARGRGAADGHEGRRASPLGVQREARLAEPRRGPGELGATRSSGAVRCCCPAGTCWSSGSTSGWRGSTAARS